MVDGRDRPPVPQLMPDAEWLERVGLTRDADGNILVQYGFSLSMKSPVYVPLQCHLDNTGRSLSSIVEQALDEYFRKHEI